MVSGRPYFCCRSASSLGASLSNSWVIRVATVGRRGASSRRKLRQTAPRSGHLNTYWASHLRERAFALVSAADIDSSSMRHKATLPLLLLLLVAGQLSAEFCMVQCQGMRMTEPACAMHEMARDHCASCKHASASDTSASLSALGTCPGQACNSVLGLALSRPDHEVGLLIPSVSFDVLVPPVLVGMGRMHYRDARSTRSIRPFGPLTPSLRI
jgi:hypothetical protein